MKYCSYWSLFNAAVLSLAVAGCVETQPSRTVAVSAAPNVTPSSFRMPQGSGCAGKIARFRAVIDNDVKTGNVEQPVYNKMSTRLDHASSLCAAGEEGAARQDLASTRTAFGYP